MSTASLITYHYHNYGNIITRPHIHHYNHQHNRLLLSISRFQPCTIRCSSSGSNSGRGFGDPPAAANKASSAKDSKGGATSPR
ncbi:hypothetical protein Tco_1296822, partial [Tanacetum coccineum]